MTFGDLRSMLHRGDLPPLFATLPEDQHGYAERMAGERLAARAHRMRLAQWLVYAEDPLALDIRKKIAPALYPLLRWYACDVASESMRMHGNGGSRSLRAIEASRAHALGRASEEDLKQARKDAIDAADAAFDAAYAAAYAAYAAVDAAAYAAVDAAAYAAACAAAAAPAADADADADAIWSATYRKHRTHLTNWFRAYLMRWIEEGAWWEVSS